MRHMYLLFFLRLSWLQISSHMLCQSPGGINFLNYFSLDVCWLNWIFTVRYVSYELWAPIWYLNRQGSPPNILWYLSSNQNSSFCRLLSFIIIFYGDPEGPCPLPISLFLITNNYDFYYYQLHFSLPILNFLFSDFQFAHFSLPNLAFSNLSISSQVD